MMKRILNMNYYEVLEVGMTADAQEIHRAYDRLKKEYDPNSVAFYSLFTPEESTAISRRIEEAYRTLIDLEKRRSYDTFLQEGGQGPFAPAASEPAQQRRAEETGAEPRQHPGESAPRPEPPPAVDRNLEEFSGPAIKALRQQLGLDVRDISNSTKIGARHLECIEEEDYQKLPPRTYIRGFLILYAKALGCDPDRMSSDYLRRYDASVAPPKRR